ncbi:hypothetical protein [Parapedobacter soli]|uniref:hypothetical protein n=1 Tax=Parapedobacter soli TaxID=416955 RepID=UPI0021C7CC6B|nr:hypothetical protein [Parapedobacter soli]
MMQRSVKLKLNLAIALWYCAMAVANGQVDSPNTEVKLEKKLWEAIGGQENWQNARYFMFSCVGGRHSFVQGERRYLWDKQTGNCRFDGVTTDDEAVTALFNIRTGKGAAYINDTELDNPRTTADIVAEITEEFTKDALLLFLPTILDDNHVSYSISGEKLIGSQRITVVDIENKHTNTDVAIVGQLYIDSQTGRIREWRPSHEGSGFSVGGYKAIGSGLMLPTRFTNSDSAASVTFPIAAALVHIEGQKFNKP